MSNYTYTSDIFNDALFRSGEATDGSSDFTAQALTYLNHVYMQICRGGSELAPSVNEDWTWLQKAIPGTLILKPAITDTCQVTQNSTTVTLANAQASLVDYYFKISGHPDVFRVSAHTGATTAVTLEAVYTGADDSAATYTAYVLDYDLASDVMRITAPMRCYVASLTGGWGRYQIFRASSDDLSMTTPLMIDNTGVPDLFAEIGPRTSGIKRIRFNGYLSPTTTNYVKVEYEYLYRPTALTTPGTAEEPVLPLEWRHLLSDFVLAFLYGIKNDDRAGPASQMAQSGLMGMAQENRYRSTTATKNLFRIKSRGASNYRRGPLRTETGIILG